MTKRFKQVGFSLVEMLLVAALAVLIFGALFSSFQYIVRVMAISSAKTSALSLANDQMEYFRSLPYDDVGTIAGIPAGTIPQMSTTTLNNIEFTQRVLVEYVDDPADGLLTATTTDSNGIPADYKRIKVEISWQMFEETQSIFLVSNIVPRSIETTDGGGTVRINVIDENSNPLAGASVTLINNTTTTTINVAKLSDSSGTVLFSGAPAASNYEVVVTGTGYSTDGTYAITGANPSPVTSPFSVLEADISTLTFQIDALSDISLVTYSDITDASDDEWFDDMSGVASSTNTAVSGGRLELANSGGVYASAGTAFLSPINPATLERWEAVTLAGDAPNNTSYVVRFYTATSSGYSLIPDSDLPGNSAGFSDAIISIKSLSVVDYPSLVVGVSLSTSDTGVTPTIDAIETFYREGATARTGVDFSASGNKIIGHDASLLPIKKHTLSGTTDGAGEYELTDIEFDTYTFDFGSLRRMRSCPVLPLQHHAGVDSEIEIELAAVSGDTVLVTVLDASGRLIPGATVELARTGFTDTIKTNTCGQAFFSSGVIAASDYTIVVSKSGYNTETVTPYDLSGESVATVTLSDS